MRMRRSLATLLTAASAIILGLAGCGRSGTGGEAAPHGGGHDQGAPAAVEGAPELAVTATSFRFEPVALTLTAGEPVNIVLTSADTLHDFTLDEQDFHLAAEPGSSDTGALTIDKPGTYTAACTVPGHREAGMEATITVQ
jgi:uncharacterized cupredoxin-like copper-binding protein